jgi:site-specific recombinase XerD
MIIDYISTDEPKTDKNLDRVSDNLRLKQYSNKTEGAYLIWIKQYILFHDKKCPQCMSASEVKAFLTYLAVDREVAASNQNQAFSAILFLYREVLQIPLKKTSFQFVGAKKPKRLPAVLTKTGAQQMFVCLSGNIKLIVQLHYGSGAHMHFARETSKHAKLVYFEPLMLDFSTLLLISLSSSGHTIRSSISQA